MSKAIKQQLASIRREASRIELARMREHVKAKRRKLDELEADERTWTKARKAERRARLKAIRNTIRQALAAAKQIRAGKLQVIVAKRKQFQEWWQAVRQERAARLANIAQLRQELRDWTREGPARRKAAVEEITAAAQRQLDSFDTDTAVELGLLGEAVAKARAELKSDEYDLKTWTSNRRREGVRGKRPVRVTRRESVEELASNVESNLDTAEERAWWRRQRPSILRRAKELGKTEGDEIAEMIRESVEAEPERALEFLMADSDAWVEAEIRRVGFAA